MEKILPFDYPLITYIPWTASTLGVSMTCKNSLDWIFMNFVHIEIRSVCYDGLFYQPECNFFDVSPWVSCKAIPQCLLREKWGSFHSFCKDAIDNEYYIYSSIDTYYVPPYINYKLSHQFHELFIYGYNNKSESFYIGDFFQYSQADYILGICKYKELDDAYNEMILRKNKSFWDKDVVLFQRNEDLMIDVGINMLKSNLIQYLASCNLYGLTKMGDKDAFNFAVYDLLISYCICIKDHLDKNVPLKAFNIIFIHKKFMKIRLEYISQKHKTSKFENIIESYSKLMYLCNINQSYAIKYNIAKKLGLLEKLISNLNQIKNDDKNITQELINIL
jgi:hypothetical protein